MKRINPDVEIIVQTYVPGAAAARRNVRASSAISNFPTTPEEWATDRWFRFAMRKDPDLSWLPPELRRKIHGFETVMNARWPTVQDWRLPRWAPRYAEGPGKLALRVGRVRQSGRAALGAEAGSAAPTTTGEPVSS